MRITNEKLSFNFALIRKAINCDYDGSDSYKVPADIFLARNQI